MIPSVCFALFDSAIGRCALAWRNDAIVRVRLPAFSNADLRSAIALRHAGALEREPSGGAAEAIERIQALLSGGADDLRSLAVDFDDAPEFNRSVYAATREIPPGRTRTYGEIAVQLGDKNAARAVGAALGANPVPIIVPCHRVLAAGGRTGGFTAPGGVDTKMRMLAIERARIGEAPGLFDDDPDFVVARRRR